MLGFKISVETVFLLSLIIPFLIKPINGLYDINELAGSMEGKTVDDLAAAMDSGKIYLNVQTTAHPDGEIRDQLSKSDKS